MHGVRSYFTGQKWSHLTVIFYTRAIDYSVCVGTIKKSYYLYLIRKFYAIDRT